MKTKNLLICISLCIALLACSKSKSTVKVVDGVKHVYSPKQKIVPLGFDIDIKIEGETDDYTICDIAQILEAPNGDIYVLDSEDSNVKVFDNNGKYIKTIAKKGSGPGELKSPQGIGFLANGNILISDDGNARFNEYSADGTYLNTYKEKVTGMVYPQADGSFYIMPSGMHVGSDHASKGVVHKYDKNFEQTGGFCEHLKHDEPIKQLIFNLGFATQKNGYFYVNFMISNCIRRFKDGKLDMEISREVYVEGEGGFKQDGNSLSISIKPLTRRIACDSKGNIYSTTHAPENPKEYTLLLEKFNKKGELVKTYGIDGYYAEDMYIGKDDKFYFSSSDDMSIQRYSKIKG